METGKLMAMRARFLGLFVLALLAVSGCNSIVQPVIRPLTKAPKPNYKGLPVEALNDFAQAVEGEIRSGNREAAFDDVEGLVLSTTIQQAIRARIARGALVSTFLDTGHAWERRHGLVAILHSSEYRQSSNRKAKNRDALVVMSENADRWAIYEGLVEANDFPRGAVAGIQAVFTDARIDWMKRGQKYEDESGQVASRP